MMPLYNPFNKDIAELEAADLLMLKTVHEGWYVDYKAAPLNAHKYAKAISAMANTYGGWVFVGIEEESRNNNVAGSFPGIQPENIDVVCQQIRQGAAEHLNPSPFFTLKAVTAPDQRDGRKIICLRVPASPKAPIIHSDGRIYRRVNDSSEPVAENSREAIEHLFRRLSNIEEFYKEWFADEPELSEPESDVTYIRIIAAPDYYGEKNLLLDIDFDEFISIIEDKPSGTSFFNIYNNIYSQQGGFVCRSAAKDDARKIGSTFLLWRDLRSEFWLPLQSFVVSDYYRYHPRNDLLDALVRFLERSGHGDSTAVDFSHTFGAIDAYLSLLRKFQQRLQYDGPTYAKFELGNAWRRIPLLSIPLDALGWEKHGAPIILNDKITSHRSGSIDTFTKLNLHNNEIENIGHCIPIFMNILTSIGFAVGSSDNFTKIATDAAIFSFNGALKNRR